MRSFLIAMVASGLLAASASAMASPNGHPPGLNNHSGHGQHSPLQRKFLQARHGHRHQEQRRGHHRRHEGPGRHHSSRHQPNRHYHQHHHYHGQRRHGPSRHHYNRYRNNSSVFGFSDGQRGVLIIRR